MAGRPSAGDQPRNSARTLAAALANYATNRARQQSLTADCLSCPRKDHAMRTTYDETQSFLAHVRLEAPQIDPDTAEVTWVYTNTFDPYGLKPDLPSEYQGASREYFARRPGSEIWVWFGDLPNETRTKLLERHERELAFPAGLE